MSARRGIGSAFTVVELLIVVLIIALLLALLTPGIAAARAHALRARTLSSLQQNAAVLTQYTIDWRDYFPAYVNPQSSAQSIPLASGSSYDFFGYFSATFFWGIALSAMYYDGNISHPAFFDAEQSAKIGGRGDRILLPCTYFAKPVFWNAATRTGVDQLGPTFAHDVVFPSRKSLLVSIYRFYSPVDGVRKPNASETLAPHARVDGSAAVVKMSKFRPGVGSAEGNYVLGPHPFDFAVGLHTVDGLHGRDLP